MNTVSFMTANYVARQVGYNMTEGWGQGAAATENYFKPVKTFGERFEVYLLDIKAMGFEALDLWTAILNPTWATDKHITAANDLLHEHDLTVVSLAGGFGDNANDFEASCDVATALGAEILGGFSNLLTKNRALMTDILRKYGVIFGLENHPEKTPEALLAKIGHDDEDVIGLCVDTGWWGTSGYDAPTALEKLAPRLVHLHLKDVLAPGGHETCRYGAGCVQIEQCVKMLKQVGYTGGISVEHEPEHFDPTEDCRASLKLLQAWLDNSHL